MISKNEYEKILSQEYQIPGLEQFLARYRCNIDISIFCAPWKATPKNKKLALSIPKNPRKLPE